MQCAVYLVTFGVDLPCIHRFLDCTVRLIDMLTAEEPALIPVRFEFGIIKLQLFLFDPRQIQGRKARGIHQIGVFPDRDQLGAPRRVASAPQLPADGPGLHMSIALKVSFPWRSSLIRSIPGPLIVLIKRSSQPQPL